MKKPLSIPELAKVAHKLLLKDKGFTIDEYGEPADGKIAPWAVSVKGKERSFAARIYPLLCHVEQYLRDFPLNDGAHFGGWIDNDGICYLDYTLLFDHKHSAVYEGLQNKQKAIYNLATGETVNLADVPQVPQCDHPRHRNPGLTTDCPECGARFDPE